MPVVRDRHEQAAAALASDPRGHDVVQMGCRQLQGFGNAQSGLKGQRRIELRRRLPKFDHRLEPRRARFDLRADLDDADAAVLAANPHRAPAQGQKHRVGSNGGVPHEGGFLARVEETQAHIVVRGIGREHKGHLGMRKLAGDG